ncbi:MAG: hypothetical protein NTY12_03560 [Candidatus Falkowbacteria bacterium]|nr:hypothetical protein [Candidatus Falkowbacteria bacterium]
MKKTVFTQSASIIIGTIIGAGILGLPFAFMKAGFLTGLMVLLIISSCVIILALFLGEITLRTNGKHQVSGYVGVYLGKHLKNIQAILLLFGMYGALLAYTIGQGQILSNLFGGSKVLWSIIAYIFLSILVVKGLALIKRIEFIIGLLILGFIFVIGVLSTPHINIDYWHGFSLAKFFIPYGAILFACSGLVAIPEAKEIISASKGQAHLRSAILVGYLIPILIYISFTAIIIAVTGPGTTEIATIGLTSVIGPAALLIGSLFSIVAMSSGFMALGNAIKEIYQYDYKLKPILSITLTLAVPILMFLLGLRDFFGVVSLAGALSVGLTGLIVIIVFWRARKNGKRKPEYTVPSWLAIPASIIISIMLIIGLIYTI